LLTAGLFLVGTAIATAQESNQESAQSTGQAASGARITVHGLVRNAATGEPLARALVQIEGDADTGALTDNEGRFEIPGLPAGPQTFSVAKPGFRDRPYATEEAGSQAEGPGHSVLVAAQMPELDFALSPNCAIHGRIELSTGDPAEGIKLMLVKQVVQFGRSIWSVITNTRTNSDGTYRFGGLSDGIYALFTEPALESEPAATVVATGSAANVARNGYASVYYSDAHDLAGAAQIRLTNGSQTEANIALTLEPFYPVTVIAIAPGNPSGAGREAQQVGYTAVVTDASGHQLPYTAQYDATTHSLQANLPDGTYTLIVHDALPDNTADSVVGGLASVLNGNLGFAGSAEFTVAGHPIIGLRIPLAPPPAATVHLRLVQNSNSPTAFSASEATQSVNVSIDQADGGPSSGPESLWSMTSQRDSITFTAEPGTYWLSAFVNHKGLCAGSLSAGGLNLARDPLVLGLAAAPPPMELTLRDDCGTLALSLPPALTAFLPGEEPYYTVYVVPDFDTMQQIPPMTMHPSSGPTLNLDSLTPGSYHVYVFDLAVHLEYRNAAAMAALANAGQQVTVSAGVTTSLTLEAPGH
jgi:Carboxypeptidase regulatory-like domain